MGKVVTIVTIKLICPSQIVYLTDYLERYHHIYSIDLFKNNTSFNKKTIMNFLSFLYRLSSIFKQTNKNVCNLSTVRNKASFYLLLAKQNIYIKFYPPLF